MTSPRRVGRPNRSTDAAFRFHAQKSVRARRGDTIIDNRDLPYDTPPYRKVEPQADDELSQAVEDYNRAIRRRRRNGRSENRHSR